MHLFSGLGAALLSLGIALGAMGSHLLRERLPAELMRVWETGAQYHLINSVGLVLLGLLISYSQQSVLGAVKPLTTGGWLLFSGICLFAGSLYLRVLTDNKMFGMLAPIGGVLLILSWAWVAYAVFSNRTA